MASREAPRAIAGKVLEATVGGARHQSLFPCCKPPIAVLLHPPVSLPHHYPATLLVFASLPPVCYTPRRQPKNPPLIGSG